MAQFWIGTVSITNGSKFVTVDASPDDLGLVRPNSLLQIGDRQFVEVKDREVSTSTIELFYEWEGGGVSNQPAISAPSAAELQAAIADVRKLTQVYENFADNLGELLTSTDETIEIGNETIVPWGYLRDKFEAESSGLLTEFETDLKRNRLLALAGIVL